MEERKKQIREAVMDTFRGWGGYWNVSARPPAESENASANWKLRVHSHPFTHGELPADLIDAYLDGPGDEETVARWEATLRPIFDQARAEAG
jgi:hypothetical protein